MSPTDTTFDTKLDDRPSDTVTDDASFAGTHPQWTIADDEAANAASTNSAQAAGGLAGSGTAIAALGSRAVRGTRQGIRSLLETVRRSPRKPMIIALAVVIALVVAVAGTLVAMAKTVTITVDGQSQQVTTLSGSVHGAIESAGLTVGAHDSLAPSGQSDISDGSEIVLNRGRTFTVTMDGAEQKVWTTASTVSAALAEMGEDASDFELSTDATAAIPLGGLAVTADSMHTVEFSTVPAPGAENIAMPVSMSIASAPEQRVKFRTAVTTAAKTVGDFLDDKGVAIAVDQRVTPALDTPLTDDIDITVATLPTVSMQVGNGDPKTVFAQASTVGAMLAKQDISLGDHDKVKPKLSTPITHNMDVAVTRVKYKTTTKTEKVAQPADKKVNDSELAAGKTKVVQQGHPGEAKVTYKTKIVNGKAGDPKEASRETVKKATATITHVGTKQPPKKKATSPSGSSGSTPAKVGSNGVNWAGVAQCESGNNWSINTGNGYYGGLQFDIGTWLGNGGGKYAPRADLATKAQQIDIANYVYAHRGLQPWGCGWAG